MIHKHANTFSVLISAFIGSTALFVILKAVLEKYAELPNRLSLLIALIPFAVVFYFAQQYIRKNIQTYTHTKWTDYILPASFFILLTQYPNSFMYGLLDTFGTFGTQIIPMLCIGLLFHSIFFVSMPAFVRIFSTIIAGLLLFFVTQETTLSQNYISWLQKEAELSPEDTLSVALAIDVLFYGIIGFIIHRIRKD